MSKVENLTAKNVELRNKLALLEVGIRAVPFQWFSSCLSNRMQCVRIGRVQSQNGHISFGVSQGSVLGSILFLIYINDLCVIVI